MVLLRARDEGVRVLYDFKVWAPLLPSVQDWQKAFDWPAEGENFLVWVEATARNTGSRPAEARLVVEQLSGKTPSTPAYSWTLSPGTRESVVIREPFMAIDDPAVFDKEDATLWLKRTTDYGKGVLTAAAHIEAPCRKATGALRAAHVCQLIASDHGKLQPGEGF